MAHKHKSKHKHNRSRHLAELGTATETAKSEEDKTAKERAKTMLEQASKAAELSDRAAENSSNNQDRNGSGRPDASGNFVRHFDEGSEQGSQDIAKVIHWFFNPIVTRINPSPNVATTLGRAYSYGSHGVDMFVHTVAAVTIAKSVRAAAKARAAARALKPGAANAEGAVVEDAAGATGGESGGVVIAEAGGAAAGETGVTAGGLGLVVTALGNAAGVLGGVATGRVGKGIALGYLGYQGLRKTGVLGRDAPGAVEATGNAFGRIGAFLLTGHSSVYDNNVNGDAAGNLSAQIIARGIAKAKRMAAQRKAKMHSAAAHHNRSSAHLHARHITREASGHKLYVKAHKPSYSRNAVGSIIVQFPPIVIPMSRLERELSASHV